MKNYYKQEDRSTKEHSKRVAILCRHFAQMFDYDEKLAYQIGINHDVGKIFIPQRILKKNGELTWTERELIDMHSYFGYRILKGAGYDRAICIPVLYHHGFDKPKASPIEEQNLTQQELQLIDVVVIADVLDALTSNRPYHEKRSVEEAFEIMRKNQNINQNMLQAIIDESLRKEHYYESIVHC